MRLERWLSSAGRSPSTETPNFPKNSIRSTSFDAFGVVISRPSQWIRLSLRINRSTEPTTTAPLCSPVSLSCHRNGSRSGREVIEPCVKPLWSPDSSSSGASTP